ncbi:pentapeptide repeat-containing protein [Streptomyces europaeiscabiei]|uniref:pentapeptide repeat-containing protein n=1 Tax=Streptomyces europaeiscabiei TaxID=146819 RepID=UPI0038F6F98A
MDEVGRAAYLATLTPGADIDHRGTAFTKDLLDQLLAALRDSATGRPHLGAARFDGATFTGDARFHGATFTGNARFVRATFAGTAGFGEATFTGEARFNRATFTGEAWFNDAAFAGNTWFSLATFTGDARFGNVTFDGAALFGEASFTGGAWFSKSTFTGPARFEEAAFTSVALFREVTFASDARFDCVTFTCDARFDEGAFTGKAQFGKTTFTGDARFRHVAFDRAALFGRATFIGDAQFDAATFTNGAQFRRATFTGDALFRRATFTGQARFDGVTFTGDTRFEAATFISGPRGGGAWFCRTRFETTPDLGPLACDTAVYLDDAVFGAPVTVKIVAGELSLRRTRWTSTAALRLRYAEVDLTGAVLECPISLAPEPAPFPGGERFLPEEMLANRDAKVRVRDISGVDAAHLALADVDLSECRFAGAVHLDQLRLDGRVAFGRPPTGWHRRGPVPLRWSRRRTLAEEHHWRAAAEQPASDQQSAARAWRSGPHHPDAARTPRPETVAAVYRQLRKALEDGKNEPGAADFYYGECEMRRHDTDATPAGERALLTAYWVLSGYGLRTARALAWLGTAMIVSVLALMLWGLPADSLKPTTTGRQVAVGQMITLATETPDPTNPTGPFHKRVTTDRFEKALRVVINSVIFRSSGQDLTTAGTYTEMASRLTEPILLGLAVLAVRSRVKR